MATSITSCGSLDHPVEALSPPLSVARKKGGELAPPDLAVCVLAFLRSFDSHRVPGEPGLVRSRRHARFFRPGAMYENQTSQPLHPALWELLRDVAAVTELAVDVHLRALLQRSTAPDFDSGDAVSFTEPHEPAVS